MALFDEALIKTVENLGYELEPKTESGADVSFIKGAHKIEIYYSDGEWYIFSESRDRAKAEEGYMFNESYALSGKELSALNDILTEAGRKVNGG